MCACVGESIKKLEVEKGVGSVAGGILQDP